MTIRRSDETEALTAASDAATLLRLAADALELVRDRVHGETYEHIDDLYRDLTGLHRRAEDVEREVQDYVTARAHAR